MLKLILIVSSEYLYTVSENDYYVVKSLLSGLPINDRVISIFVYVNNSYCNKML
jgi:hypothetical protein